MDATEESYVKLLCRIEEVMARCGYDGFRIDKDDPHAGRVSAIDDLLEVLLEQIDIPDENVSKEILAYICCGSWDPRLPTVDGEYWLWCQPKQDDSEDTPNLLYFSKRDKGCWQCPVQVAEATLFLRRRPDNVPRNYAHILARINRLINKRALDKLEEDDEKPS